MKIEQEESLKEMVNNIAHQWRQPLSQINATVSMIDKILYEKNIEDALLEEKLQDIEAITKNMSNIIDDFKKYFDTGGKKQCFSLKNLILNAVGTLAIVLKESDIRLTYNLQCDVMYEAYESELKQTIVILLNNAKDALEERNVFHAKINIDLLELEDKYLIQVTDNAGGIAKSVKEKLFEPHFTTKHHSKGSGIGLYMTRKIVQEKLEGDLEVENVDEGSCFSIILPRKKK